MYKESDYVCVIATKGNKITCIQDEEEDHAKILIANVAHPCLIVNHNHDWFYRLNYMYVSSYSRTVYMYMYVQNISLNG